MLGFGILILFVVIIILDIIKKVDLTSKLLQIPFLLIFPHYIILIQLCIRQNRALPAVLPDTVWKFITFLLLNCIFFYYCIRLHFFPVRGIRESSLQAWILYGGRRILLSAVGGFILQALLYLLFLTGHLPVLDLSFISHNIPFLIIADAVFAAIFLWLLFMNGLLRILLGCYRLGIVKRIIIFLTLWIPFVQIYLIYYICKKAKEEYAQECCRFENASGRDGQAYCATRYPLILLHGIGFRDLNFFNYWGRIPKNLVKNGAIVYYGHQEAWGTIEDNAAYIKTKIEEILTFHQCDRVNIIAHSKGGLDARYLISALQMETKVASLTTISTPHHGSELITILNKLPDKLYHRISGMIDKTFQKAGDTHPDCYHSSKQLDPAYCELFNCEYPDSPTVYYQSYASMMGRTWDDTLLGIPNLLMNLAGARNNDGLVTELSAQWGDFRGTFRSKGKRGISHGDMIDLKREDYKGFDVIEAYISIVHDLKEKGF